MAGCSGLSGFSSTALLEKNANHEQHISAASQKDSAQDYKYDLRRGDQLRALANGFDRFADRLEQEARTEAV